jgi:hypothetical protein
MWGSSSLLGIRYSINSKKGGNLMATSTDKSEDAEFGKSIN